MSDIKRAQHLSIRMSAIDNSIPHRSVRSIVRGDVDNLGNDAEDTRHRKRRYLVATDLSEESVYALEWTIGTILRDGDMIIAVYAKEKEGVKDPESKTGNVQDVAGPQQAEEEAAVDPQSGVHNNSPRGFFGRSRFGGTSAADSKPSPHNHHHHHHQHHHHHHEASKAEAERVRAVETITQTCVRLLRKTLLQVQVAVEVIHCKSPRHMITEAVSMSERLMSEHC